MVRYIPHSGPAAPSTLWAQSALTALALVLCLSASLARAEAPADKPAQAPVLKDEPATRKTPDAKVEQTVIEDDSNRVEETRVRGQTQKVTVQPKNSPLPSYEIIMGDASRDPSQGNSASRGAAGARVWRLLTF
ncbi:hypothetical protein [Paucibacter sp. KCTC 42545]|uniref:hypothetical protein n=1 Tax=Paucibacter sp. KCTC 42545 TaxID=1768242 RepID=UPI0012E3CEB2|nr:hypothetical protein [Paucibacter sp. KCTC 42545]